LNGALIASLSGPEDKEGLMALVAVGVVAGLLGTLAMDGLNLLFSRSGIISRIDVGMIGRMAVGWARGRFRYRHPTEMVTVEKEVIYGIATHYAIGVALAVPYVVGWTLLVGGPASPAWAVVYGIATTMASWFFVYPSMGFRALGMGSPDGLKAPLSALANHLFYGLGVAAGLTLINPVCFSV
jgi:uncharacterized membrane protein YeaQ/YmgE (transglycosylase-associated protein family)